MIGLGAIAAITGMFKTGVAFFKGFSMLKYVSPAIASFMLVKDYVVKYWKITAIVALAVMLVGVTWLKDREIRSLEAEAVVMQAASANYLRTLGANARAYEECITINRENARGFFLMQLQADNAVISLQNKLAKANQKVEVIYEDISGLRGKDETCRTLDEPLPDWFDDWLRE